MLEQIIRTSHALAFVGDARELLSSLPPVLPSAEHRFIQAGLSAFLRGLGKVLAEAQATDELQARINEG